VKLLGGFLESGLISSRRSRGLRSLDSGDKLIHHYFVVDLEVVWASATEDVPQLKPHLIEMIRELQW
jgi:uncharacterized protein with HEPN domain